jgi:hypothetical protein
VSSFVPGPVSQIGVAWGVNQRNLPEQVFLLWQAIPKPDTREYTGPDVFEHYTHHQSGMHTELG